MLVPKWLFSPYLLKEVYSILEVGVGVMMRTHNVELLSRLAGHNYM